MKIFEFLLKNARCLILKHTSPVSSSFSLKFFSTSSEGNLCYSRRVFDILRHNYDFPPELASRAALKLNRIRNPENADLILSFLKEIGFSSVQLEKLVKNVPRILAVGIEGYIKPKIKFFKDLGFSSGDICKLISCNPKILQLSLNNNIVPSISILKGLLGSDNDVNKVVKRSPWFFNVNAQNRVVLNVEFLKSCGIPMRRIRTVLVNSPNCFFLNTQVIKKSVEKAIEMGLDASSSTFIYAIPAIGSMSNEAWELKFQAFRDLGFSDSDVLTMFRKNPFVVSASMEKIRKITELLLATGKFNISSIVNCPLSLLFSIENRYRPRLRVLEIMESRGLIKEWPDLGYLCRLSNTEFSKRFINPYSNEVLPGAKSILLKAPEPSPNDQVDNHQHRGDES